MTWRARWDSVVPMLMRRPLPVFATAMVLPLLASCGGARSPTPTPTPTPIATSTPTPSPTPTPTSTTPDFSAVSSAIDAYADDNFAVLIGDETGILYSRIKGTFPLDQQQGIASASKWFTAATIMRLVDRGVLSLDDNPQDYLTYWTSDVMDARSRITLEQLLSFTSGLNGEDDGDTCTYDVLNTMQNCVREIYDDGVDTVPGTTLFYGPEHMHVAAAMAESATGKAYVDIFVDELANPLGLSEATRFTFPSQRNPLASGGLSSSAQDTAIFMTAMLANTLVADRDNFLTERTSTLTIGFRPASTQGTRDWQYALGGWLECDDADFNANCAAAQVFSSPGAFGWTPWIDLPNGYWGLIARRGGIGTAEVAVTLEQQLQPLIVAALAP